MLLPLFGLAFATVSSAGIGAIVLALYPRWKVTATTITLSAVSGLVAAVPASLLYTWLMVDARRQLHAAAVVIGYFVVVLLAVAAGGTLGTALGLRLLNENHKPS